MKVEVDCSKCDGKYCCTLRVKPFGIEMICMNSVDGMCGIEGEKPLSCALYPFITVMDEWGRILLCVDTNCPEADNAKLEQALSLIAKRPEEVIILTENDLYNFDFKLKILGALTDGEDNTV